MKNTFLPLYISIGLSILLTASRPSASWAQGPNDVKIEGNKAAACPQLLTGEQAREKLIKAYLDWNARTPQNGGVNIVAFAMASVILQDPLAIQVFGAPLSDAEVDHIGETLNRTHVAYGIPVRYTRNREEHSFGPEVKAFVSPEEIQMVFDAFSFHAMRIIKTRIEALELNENLWSKKTKAWRNVMSLNHVDYEQTRSSQKILQAYFDSAKDAKDKALLARLGTSFETVLKSEHLKEASQTYREAFRNRSLGNPITRLGNGTLEVWVHAFLESQIKKDFPELSEEQCKAFAQSISMPN